MKEKTGVIEVIEELSKTKRRSSLVKMETLEHVSSDDVPDYVPACTDDYVTRSGRFSRLPIRL